MEKIVDRKCWNSLIYLVDPFQTMGVWLQGDIGFHGNQWVAIGISY